MACGPLAHMTAGGTPSRAGPTGKHTCAHPDPPSRRPNGQFCLTFRPFLPVLSHFSQETCLKNGQNRAKWPSSGQNWLILPESSASQLAFQAAGRVAQPSNVAKEAVFACFTLQRAHPAPIRGRAPWPSLPRMGTSLRARKSTGLGLWPSPLAAFQRFRARRGTILG